MNVSQGKLQKYNKLRDMKAIKRKPIYSLRGCLQYYGENMLQTLEKNLKIEETKKGEAKGERINQLEFAIRQDMKQQLLYLTKRQAYFLLECKQKPYINNISDAYGLDTVFSLIDVGWIYWFAVGDEVCFVLPEELKEIVKDTFFEDSTFFEQLEYYELSEYIEAFVHLYGAFETNHLFNVWNRQHPNNRFTFEQLEKYVKRVSGRQSVFESEGDLIYGAGDFNMDIAENLMNSVFGLPYYIPQPDEVWALAYKSIQDTVQFQQLEKYVRRWNTDQADQVLAVVLNYVRIGMSDEEVTKELVTEGLLDPTKTTFINKFSFFYKKLLNDTRTWLCRGHKPQELEKIKLLWQEDKW